MILTIAFVVALVLAIVDEILARGRDLMAWAVIVLAGALLYARLA